jgi:hypothetical protein
LRRPQHHRHHPLSLTNASWGCFWVSFPHDGRHVTTSTPSRSQTRVGGGVLFFPCATAAASPTPPPLARKCELGVFLGFVSSRRPPRHHQHPLLLANASWGCFCVQFSRDGHHIITTTLNHCWATTTMTTNPSLAPRARRRGLVSVSTAPSPPLAPRASRRGFVYVCTSPPTPPSPQKRDGGVSFLYPRHHPPPSPQEQGRGVISIYMHMPTPSLVLNTSGGVFLGVFNYN